MELNVMVYEDEVEVTEEVSYVTMPTGHYILATMVALPGLDYEFSTDMVGHLNLVAYLFKLIEVKGIL